MRVVAVLQARMGSSRLPGKAIKEINGLPILWHIYRRLLACREVDQVAVALGDDNPSAALPVCEKHVMYRQIGYTNDLLQRLTTTARWFHADAILLVRADCLFVDPAILDDLVKTYRSCYPKVRGLSTWPCRKYSEVMDVEVYSMELLAELSRTKECPREGFAAWLLTPEWNGAYGCGQRFDPAPNDGLPHLSIDTQEDFDRAEAMLKILSNDQWNYAETLKAWEATK